jgi:hypothetical protein
MAAATVAAAAAASWDWLLWLLLCLLVLVWVPLVFGAVHVASLGDALETMCLQP